MPNPYANPYTSDVGYGGPRGRIAPGDPAGPAGPPSTGGPPAAPSGGNDFESWYKNTIQANPDRYDTGRSKAQWQAWQPLYDQASGMFRSSKVDSQGNPIQGLVEHPDACPQGMQAFGQNQCRRADEIPGGAPGGAPGTGGPGGPGGQGGPGASGGPAGGALGWDTLTGMAKGFNPNLGQDYGLAKDYQGILSNPNDPNAQALMAPTLQGIAGDLQTARQQVINSIPPGGARDRALAMLQQQGTGAAQQVRTQLVPQALSQLQGLYGQQLGAGTQQLSNLLGAYTQGQGYGTQLGIAGLNAATQRAIAQGQLGLGYAGLGEQQTEFGQNLGERQYEFGAGLGQRQSEFGTTTDLERQRMQENQRQFNLSLQQQKDQQKRSFWGSLGQGLLGLGQGMFSGLFKSDLRTKEDVIPFTEGLKTLRKYSPVEYDYNGKGGSEAGLHAVSVIAQDLEKTQPKAVVKVDTPDLPEMRMVDLARILMTSVNAVKELDRDVRKLKKTRDA